MLSTDKVYICNVDWELCVCLVLRECKYVQNKSAQGINTFLHYHYDQVLQIIQHDHSQFANGCIMVFLSCNEE